MNIEANNASSELIHDDEYPVAVQKNGLTPIQIHDPETVLRVPKEG